MLVSLNFTINVCSETDPPNDSIFLFLLILFYLLWGKLYNIATITLSVILIHIHDYQTSVYGRNTI